MAESVVSFLLQKLESLLEKELKHLGGIKHEVTDVKSELEHMKAFLRDADSKEDEDERLKTWVKEVREIALDAEDVIDNFLIRFERPQRPGVCGRLSKISRTVKTMKARRQVASELRQIRSRAVNTSERRQRYQHDWSLSQSSNSSQTLNDRRNDARLVPEAMLVGIEIPKGDLVEYVLADTESCQVLAVHGMGGLGKTTMAHQVYIDARVKQRYQHHAWIPVSQSFDLQELLLKIIKQLFEGISQPVPEEILSMDTHSLKQFVQNFLGDKQYLIVLDDVWTSDSWESLKYAFPDNNCCSRLIVTTRDGGVANFVTKDLFGGIVYPLKPLTREKSWELFCARVFQGQPCPCELEVASRQILERCKGLPLGIVAISGLLATKRRNPEKWERVKRNLGTEVHNRDPLRIMKKILSLSIDDLPYDLKSCFLFLSMFPEDFLIGKQYTIKLWIAEGFITHMEDLTLEEVGDLYFNELLNRSMIQVIEDKQSDRDDLMFQVHDLMREIILQKSRNQNFCATVSKQNVTVPEGVRRLSVIRAPILDNSSGNLNLSRLRSFMLLHTSKFASSSTSYLECLQNCGVRLLKVLNYPNLPVDTFPKFITEQYNLRYLSLRDSKVKSIPGSIGRLRSLEMLDLRRTLVEELPVEILQLHGLRHIMVTRRTPGSLLGVKVPMGIGTLTSLQTLLAIQVSTGGLELIRTLGNLKQLRQFSIEQIREEFGPTLCSSIEQLGHLRKLFIQSREVNDILDVQQISSPPPFLQYLWLYGYLSKLPNWVCNLGSLVQLKLRWSKLKLDALESLQDLPSLRQLHLYDQAYDGQELRFRAGGFQRLKHLVLIDPGAIRSITVEKGAMPQLKELRLRNCTSLEEVPSGIEFLTSLEELHLINMGEQLITRLRSTTEDSDFQRIKHIPSLYMGSMSNGRLVRYRPI